MVFASTLAAVVLFTTGTGVYAYESPEVIEGHSLYPVKDNMERVEEWFARSPNRQSEFHAKMLGRRMREARHNQHRPEFAQKILDQAVNQIDRNGGLGKHLGPELRELHDRIRAMDLEPEERHKLFLEELKKFIGDKDFRPKGMRF